MANDFEVQSILSSEKPGFHTVIEPGKFGCEAVYAFRLNMGTSEHYNLVNERLELNAVVIKGDIQIDIEGQDYQLVKYDSFFLPSGYPVAITAKADSVIYIGGAVCEGYGKPFVRKYDPSLSLGEIHQIHGVGNHERIVFFTLNPEVAASRLLCGLTWSKLGSWTSWPPHKHDELEEVYCYFDMDPPHIGLHIQYHESGTIQKATVHTVQSGSFMPIATGYHPTVAMPNSMNAYFWIMVAKDPENRRYDLAVVDNDFI